MATVSQSLKLNDGVSPVLNDMHQAMTKMLGVFERMQQATNQNMDMAEMQAARENLQNVGVAIRMAQEEQARLNATMRQMEVPEVYTPSIGPTNMPRAPTVPQTNMPNLSGLLTGYGASEEKVKAINSSLEKIITTQDRINRQSQAMDFIPGSTLNKIQRADNSINSLVKSLQNAQSKQNGLNTSMDRADSKKAAKSIERLEKGIIQAIKSQEKLNRAMESGNLKAVNRAANELTRNITKAERETNRLNRAQQEHNRSLNSGSREANELLSSLRSMLGVYAAFSGVKGMFTGALGLDKMERTFQARLGDKAAGSALFEKLRQQAELSAFSLEELAKNTASFLSMTTDPKQIDGLNALAEKLAMFDTTGQGLAGAGFSIKEAMSGDIVSLAERFNMSKSLIRALGIDDLGKEGDIEGFITQFEKLLDMQNMGQDAYEELLKAPEVQLSMIKSNFKTAFSKAATASIQALQPLFDRLNSFMTGDGFDTFLHNLSYGLTCLAEGAIWAWDGLTQLWEVLTNVYAAIEPYSGVIFSVVAAFVAFQVIAAITSGVLGMYGLMTSVCAASQALQTGATFALTASQHGLNAALLACPITWIVIAFVGLIAILIYLWKTNDQVAAELIRAWNNVLNFADAMGIGFMAVFYGILNFMGTFKTTFLSILEGAINSAIGMINSFIELLNNIPGVSIDVIGQVSFAAGAQMEEEAKKQAREEDINTRLAEYNENVAKREQKVLDMLADREVKRQEKADKKNNRVAASTYDWDNFDGKQIDMGNIDEVGKVGKIDSPVEWDDDDLKLLREIAEMTAVQNFVTLKPEVQVTTGDIRNDVDIDQVVKRIEETIEIEVAAHARGVYNLG